MKTVVVVGAGPAGITAAIYLKRGGFNPILIEKMMPGGKVSLTHKIDNYPGFSSIGGSDFANNLMEQLMQNEIEITFDEVIGVSRKDVGFSVKTLSTCYDADAVIVSTRPLMATIFSPFCSNRLISIIISDIFSSNSILF